MGFKLSVIGAALLPFVTAIAQTAEPEYKPFNKTITVCRIELTAMGRAARFHFNYTYSIETDKAGIVEKITKLTDKRRPEMVREDKILECTTWKLEPSSKYFVVFSVGTTSAPNYVSIVDPNGESIKLILS